MTEILDRIAAHLVGLRMPRALEALDHTVRLIEQGELSTLEAIDRLLAEELKSAKIAGSASPCRPPADPPKTLEGFDFPSSRPWIAIASWRSPSSTSSLVPRWALFGPPGTGKSHCTPSASPR